MATEIERPDYGIDAPGVIRNFFIAGIVLLVAAMTVFARWPQVAGINLQVTAWITCTIFLVEAVLMLFYAKVVKFSHRDKMLRQYAWRGDEHVLDVGTGRGLLLVGAARRLTSGKAVGIDIWRTEDLSGNAIAQTERNMALEGVSDLCELHSMPAQKMEFADGSFDVVVSNLCLHNIDARKQRDQACREIVRVLKPNGIALISDYKNTGQYAAVFKKQGCTVRKWRNFIAFPPLTVLEVKKTAV